MRWLPRNRAGHTIDEYLETSCMNFMAIKKSIVVIATFLVGTSLAFAEESIMPFASDGCSAFPDGTFEQQQLWLSCCTAHDLAYWQGGTYQQRVAADDELHTCVEELGEPAIAALMLAGVRVGGSPYLPTEFRWGYGWSYPRGYKAVTEKEAEKIAAELKRTEERAKTK